MNQSPPWYRPTFAGRVGRLPYLLVGLSLSVVKLGLNWFIPWSFGVAPAGPPAPFSIPEQVVEFLNQAPRAQVPYLVLLAVSIPFMLVGLMLTVRRLRDVGWPIWTVVMFFAPSPINLVFLMVLCCVPGRVSTVEPEFVWLDELHDVPPTAKRVVGQPGPGRFLLAMFAPTLAGAILTLLLSMVKTQYGGTMFLGLPFVLPMMSVIIHGYGRRITLGQAYRTGFCWLGVALLSMLAFLFEGIICILMALPLVVPLVLLGSSVGYAVLEMGPGRPRELGKMLGLLVGTLPMMMGAEWLQKAESAVNPCVTSVEVDAPPDVVWKRVISFPELPPPTDLLSKAGIAYPIRARIEGTGVGAIRHCEFSTGAFVEPIEIWDEPRLLRFAVTRCPSPLREWNPFAEIHPAHLDGFLVSERGQFRLVELPNHRTRLEGTTWYRHGLWPAAYWSLWSDSILHGIHRKVLNHVKHLAESDQARK